MQVNTSILLERVRVRGRSGEGFNHVPVFNTLTKTERAIIISVAQKNANGLNYGADCEKRKNDIQYKEELIQPGQ